MTKNSRRKKSTRARASAQGTNFTQASDNSHREGVSAEPNGFQLRFNEHFMSATLRDALNAPGKREQLADLGVVLTEAQAASDAPGTAATEALTYSVGPSPVIGGQLMPISFHATPHLVVTGPALSGKTFWLDSFIRQTRDHGEGLRATVDVIDFDGALAAHWAGQNGIRTAATISEAATLLGDVMRDLRARHDLIHHLLATSDDLLPRFVIIDGWDRFAAEQDVWKVYEQVVALSQDGAERGVHVIISSEALPEGDHRLNRVLERTPRYGSLSFGPRDAGEPLIAGRGHYRASAGSITNPIVMPGADLPSDDDGLDPIRQRLGRLIRPAALDGTTVFRSQPRTVDDTIAEALFASRGETSPTAPEPPAPTADSWRYDKRQRITTVAATAPASDIDPRPLLRAVGTAIAVHYEPETEKLDLHIDADGTCDFILLGRESADENAMDGGDFIIRDNTADRFSTHLTDAERAVVEHWMRDAWAYLSEHFVALDGTWTRVGIALRNGQESIALDAEPGWRRLGDLAVRHNVNATPWQWDRGNVIRLHGDGRYQYFAQTLPLNAAGEHLGSGSVAGVGVTPADGVEYDQLQFFHEQAFGLDTAHEQYEFELLHAALRLPTPNI